MSLSALREDVVELVAMDAPDEHVRDQDLFELIQDGYRLGIPSALVTIVDVIGGAPRPLGAHMAVLADGRYRGHLSGGCIEPAVAREAMEMIARGETGLFRIGAGSPWIDLRLPCGGGLALQVIVDPEPKVVDQTLHAMHARQTFSLSLGAPIAVDDRAERTGWNDDVFHRLYVPEARLAIIGEGREAAMLARVAAASGLVVRVFSMRDDIGGFVDRRTAVVLLDHDHAQEQPMLAQALSTDAFYVGAMGSRRTHALRCDALRERGIEQAMVDRIRAPIGVVDRTRDSRSLAFSILAEISRDAAVDEARAA